MGQGTNRSPLGADQSAYIGGCRVLKAKVLNRNIADTSLKNQISLYHSNTKVDQNEWYWV
jgi:hypothetical protein